MSAGGIGAGIIGSSLEVASRRVDISGVRATKKPGDGVRGAGRAFCHASVHVSSVQICADGYVDAILTARVEGGAQTDRHPDAHIQVDNSDSHNERTSPQCTAQVPCQQDISRSTFTRIPSWLTYPTNVVAERG